MFKRLAVCLVLVSALQAAGLPIAPAILRLAKAHNWDGVEDLFKNPKGAAKELAMVLFGFQNGQVKPEQLLEAAAKAVQAELTPEEIGMVKQALQGASGGGSAPSAAAQGQRGDPGGGRAVAGQM